MVVVPTHQVICFGSHANVKSCLLVVYAYEADQFTLGLINGGVCVIEPLESKGKRGTLFRLKNGAGPSTTTVADANTNDQSRRYIYMILAENVGAVVVYSGR